MIRMMTDDFVYNIPICNKVGYVFRDACKIGYELKLFVKKFNKSFYNKNDFLYPLSLYDDFSLIGQGSKCIANTIARVLRISPSGDYEYDADVGFWMGYVFAINHFYKKINIEDDSIDWMYNGYETLHMEDPEVTLDRIKEKQAFGI